MILTFIFAAKSSATIATKGEVEMMNTQTETLKIAGSFITIKYATQKDAGISLNRIEEMLLSAHIQATSSHPCQNGDPLQ